MAAQCLAKKFTQECCYRKKAMSALLSVFGRTDLLLQMLYDNGTHFSGYLIKELTAFPGMN